jgi:hypothetical protein
LFGTHSGDEYRIAEFRVIAFESELAGTTALSTEERNAFTDALAATAQAGGPKGLELLGWFRAHPRSEISLTEHDREIANTFFPGDHQVVVILRPSDSLPSRVRFFFRESGGLLETESPFTEFSVPLVRGAQTAITEHSPATSGLMYLQPPRLPRRRISLVWPLVITTAVGLLVAWYWLSRPPERLALHIFDTAGQLRIMWEPVQGGTGHLEISDGGEPFSIELDSEQLLSGTVTFPRRTGNVDVRLVVSRGSAPPLSAAASFHGDAIALMDQPQLPSANPAPGWREPSDALRPLEEKPTEIVVPVPVAPPQTRPKFTAPAVSRPAEKTLDLTPPPIIAPNAPATFLTPAARLNPPAEKLIPPTLSQPAAVVPAQSPAAKQKATLAPRTHTTPASGRIIWTGRLHKYQDVVINGKYCSSGTIIGELPGKPMTFILSPGDLSSDGIVLFTTNPQYANSVIEPSNAQNGWSKTVYTWNPKYANEVTVLEAPAPQNQWNRLVIRCKNPKISVVVIDWALVN